MKIDPYRLLGFAFASADLFVEIEETGSLGFALGAGQKVFGQPEAALTGRHWRDIIAKADHAMVEALMAALGSAERRGPINIRLVHSEMGERRACVSFGRLPPLKTISMAVSLSMPENIDADQVVLDTDRFIVEALQLINRGRRADKKLELSLVDLPGLQAAKAKVTEAEATTLEDKIVGAMRAQSYAGALVGKLGQESYALVRPDGDTEAQLGDRLNLSLRVMLDELTGVSAVVKPLALPEADATSPVLALKHAMNSVAKKGAPKGESLADTFSRSIRSTFAQAAKFKATVAEGSFRFAYQPVVSLADRTVHHHEVLVRFRPGESPQDAILMAEDLDLIEHLDWAILKQALEILGKPENRLRLAVNLSGRSISSPAFVSRIRQAAQRIRGASDSLIFEVTESSKIEDFDLVDRHIQALRGDGHTVCLDDFGAGAASFAYLQRLQVDVVKVDGQYIKALGEPRQQALLGHLVNMCRDLGVATIAEMVETDVVAEAAGRAGFDYGQGYLFGRPALIPAQAPPPAPVAARRRGAVEVWS